VRKDVGPIYGLVNNAAVGFDGVLALMPTSQIEQLVRVNTLAPIVLTKFVVRAMLADGGGRIVNVASVIGFTGYRGLSVYGATKASLLGFTRSLAREVGGMGVTVLDGAQREQIARRSALGRLPDVDDVAGAVEFLLGDNAKSITGTVLTVDAGNTA
ncbi:MAG: SDR family oxidoreductase, partial [Candidatus Eisenbacteria bacterium]